MNVRLGRSGLIAAVALVAFATACSGSGSDKAGGEVEVNRSS